MKRRERESKKDKLAAWNGGKTFHDAFDMVLLTFEAHGHGQQENVFYRTLGDGIINCPLEDGKQ